MKIRTLLLLTIFFYKINCDRTLRFYGKKVICKYNKDYFYNVKCGIKLVSRDLQTYSTSLSLKPVIIENLRVRMKSYYKFRTEFRPLGISVDEDACGYFKLLNGTKLLDTHFFRNIPKEFANVFCPIKGPLNLTVARLEIEPYRLPGFAPVGDWYFTTYGYTRVGGKEIFLTEFKNYFEISYKYDNNNTNNNND